ncbi:hypothetical protein [Collimonas silvisoli]|uniref:hypothetical protein n=1 Tax=Collimonas silvisoli TaxID=2825884 RepID=UPI001B8CDBCC|nr:hypothetical protein [Collimonas silvisoli]
MNRVLLSAMETKEGKYIYQNKLFSGIGFSIDVEEKVSAYEMNKGIILDPYYSICAPDNNEYMQVDLTGQLSDYVLPQYLGQTFSGIGYEFTEDICDREVFLKNGVAYWEAHWHKNGNMLYFDVPNEFFEEIYEWYPSGAIKKIKISASNKFSGALDFTEDGRLRFLSSRDGLFQNLSYISTQAKFFHFEKISDIGKLQTVEEFSLLGNDIDDNFLDFMLDSKMFENTFVLKLINTNVESLNVNKLPLLRELHIDNGMSLFDNPEKSRKLYSPRFVKGENINLRIFVNGEEVL